MIWHIYSNNEKIVINEQLPKTAKEKYTPSISSSEDTIMQTDEEGDFSAEEETDASFAKEIKQDSNNKPMFLNFTSDLSPQEPYGSKRKKIASNNSSLKSQTSFKVNGVNILNRKNLDSKTVIDRIQKRRENHNHVERRRRDCINNTILELSQIIPNASLPGQKLNKGNVLKLAVDHILYLQSENVSIKHQLNQILESRKPVQSSSTNLIGDTPSYHTNNNIRPTIRSTTELSTITHIVNNVNQTQANKAPVVASLRPLLPAINEDKKVIIPRIASRQQPSSYQYSPMVQSLPVPTPLIENKLYYNATARYL